MKVRGHRERTSDGSRRRRRHPAAAVVLLAAGALLVAHAAWRVLRVERVQRQDREALELARSASLPAELPPAEAGLSARPPALRVTPDPGELLGFVHIPARGVSASIREGVSDEILEVAAGHLPGTALPGEPGNAAIAAHRDHLFAGLRSAAEGDLVHLETADGDYSYRVTRVLIVEPDDLSVLAPTEAPSLTLITCYPFDYVGPAPRRFVVQADPVAAG